MVKTKFEVRGMHCASCAATIQKTVSKAEGVSACQVNYATAKMDVEYDPRKIGAQKLRDVVQKAGYQLA
ncbi:MAG: heavy metal-associated domain-containing protein [Candidatus Micrarchaeota archaeon]|nr:heavy metal-associated domain-containing protein [Candidatus Micrarchaeota archaeon]